MQRAIAHCNSVYIHHQYAHRFVQQRRGAFHIGHYFQTTQVLLSWLESFANPNKSRCIQHIYVHVAVLFDWSRSAAARHCIRRRLLTLTLSVLTYHRLWISDVTWREATRPSSTIILIIVLNRRPSSHTHCASCAYRTHYWTMYHRVLTLFRFFLFFCFTHHSIILMI